jgi:hypothetical protein
MNGLSKIGVDIIIIMDQQKVASFLVVFSVWGVQGWNPIIYINSGPSTKESTKLI